MNHYRFLHQTNSNQFLFLIIICFLTYTSTSFAQTLSGTYEIKSTYGGSSHTWYGAILSWDYDDPHPMVSVEKNDPVKWKFKAISGKPNTYKIINTYPGKWQGASLSWDNVEDKDHPMISLEFGDPVEWRLDQVAGKANTYKIVSTYPGKWVGASISWDYGDSHPMASLKHNDPVEWELVEVKEEDNFNMIFASDSQWPWTAITDDRYRTETEEEKRKNATILNENHVKSMNKLAQQPGNVKGMIMNGDLTAYGHSDQLDKFKEIYGDLSIPMYLGLGNHDFANNVDDTYENAAANRMVNYMIEHIQNNGSTNSHYYVYDAYEFPEIETTTTGSLAYSWDVGNVHFVQLQNYPLYKREWSNYVSIGAAKRRTVKIISSLDWLEADLARARNAGKMIVLNFHDSDEHWDDFYGYHIKNLYGGSSHPWYGAFLSWDYGNPYPMVGVKKNDPVSWNFYAIDKDNKPNIYKITNTYPGKWYGTSLDWENNDGKGHPMIGLMPGESTNKLPGGISIDLPVEWRLDPVGGKPNTYKIVNTYPGKWEGASISWDNGDPHPMASLEYDDPVEWEIAMGGELKKLTDKFRSILSTYQVGAIFVGHYHTKQGKESPPSSNWMVPYDLYANINTPVFYCGSASQSKYLLVNFKGNQMTVEHVSSQNGEATRSNSKSYTLYNGVDVLPVPNEDGYVTFFNQAGYVARYTLIYTLDGIPQIFRTDNILLGNKRSYNIPGNASNIRIIGEGKTGLVWEPWRTTFDLALDAPPNKCYKSYGTTLDQAWNNNCE